MRNFSFNIHTMLQSTIITFNVASYLESIHVFRISFFFLYSACAIEMIQGLLYRMRWGKVIRITARSLFITQSNEKGRYRLNLYRARSPLIESIQ